MDAMKAFEELRSVAPSKSDWSYLPVVAAALRSRATFLRITLDPTGTTFDFDGTPARDPENLFATALQASSKTSERHLGAAMFALNATDPQAVTYETWDGNNGVRLRVEAGKLKTEKYNKAPWKEKDVTQRVRTLAKKGSSGGLFGGLFGGGSGKIEMSNAEIKVLQDQCRFAPIPIEFNKTQISKPVTVGKSLVCLVLKPPADASVLPLQLGELETLHRRDVDAGEPYSAVVAVGGNNPGLATLNLVVDGLLTKKDDPQLAAMGVRCVITCPDLQLDDKGLIVEDESYARVISDLTRKSLLLGDMLAEELVDMAALDRVEAADYVKYYADQHEARGEFDDAERLFEMLLEAQEEALGDDDPELAGTLLKIGRLREEQGNLGPAREAYKRTLDLFEDIRPDLSVVASCHAGLASLALAENDLEAAESSAQTALDMRKTNLDPNDLQLGVSFELLARIFRARYSYPQRKYLEVDTLYLQAVRILERNLGTQHLDVATLLADLSDHRRAQRRYREAEPLMKRALQIRRDKLGEEDELVAETLDSLGALYEEQGRSTQAGEAYGQALAIYEKLQGPAHEDTLRRMNDLVVLYRLYGKFALAEPLYERILGAHSDRGGLELSHDHANLALLHAAQSKFELAEQGLARALELVKPEQKSERAWLLDQQGTILLEQGRFPDAAARLNEAHDLWKEVLGSEHLDLCVNLELRGRLHNQRAQTAEAEEVFRESLRLKEATLGPLHRETLSALGSVAEAVRNQGRTEEARKLHSELLVRRERAAQTPENEDAAAAVGGRYSVAKRQAEEYSRQATEPAKIWKRYGEAENLYLRALFTAEQALGPTHPDVAYALDDLADLYKSHRKFEAAVELCQRTLALRRRTLGATHPEVSVSLCAQIEIYTTQSRWSQAEPLTREWMTVVDTTVGDSHPETAKVLETQARIYGAAGALEKQEECNRRALEVRRTALGTEHPDFATSLADLLVLQKKYEEASRLYSFVASSLEESLGSESAELIPVYEKYAGVLRKLNREALAVELETQAMVMRVQHGLDFGDN